jgi:hypothetical protein
MAAKRCVKYWEYRVDIFGPDEAFQPFRLDDNVRDVLGMGTINLLEADPSSEFDRDIFFFHPRYLDKKVYTVPTFIKAFWYVLHVALENEQTAKKGVIFMGFPDKVTYSKFDPKLLKAVIRSVQNVLPIRLSCYHFCHPPTFFHAVWPVVRLLISERSLRRFVVHSGAKEHVIARLQKYGMDITDIPLPMGGKREISIQRWMSEREKYEKTLDTRMGREHRTCIATTLVSGSY